MCSIQNSYLVHIHRYSDLIKQRDNPLRTSQDIKYLREQADEANRKAEDAREKNALLRAHLLDLERQKDDFALEEVFVGI